MRDLVKWIEQLIRDNQMYKFYKSRSWIELKNSVMEEFHHECGRCRAKGKITKAVTVHHINHVKDRPDLALSEYYIDDNGNKQRNLIPLCARCHNEVHPEKLEKARNKNSKVVDERFKERW